MLPVKKAVAAVPAKKNAPVKKAAPAPVKKPAAKAPVKPAAKAPAAKPAQAKKLAKLPVQIVPAKVPIKTPPRRIVEDIPRRPKLSPADLKGEKKKVLEALLDIRDQLTNQVRSISAANLTSTKQAGEELADIGSDNFYREIGLSMLTEDGKKLASIQEAVNRLLNGTYGTCADCGCKVGDGRLKAIPYAKLCIDCQAEQEKQALMPDMGFEEEETASTFGGEDSDESEEAEDAEDDAEEEEES